MKIHRDIHNFVFIAGVVETGDKLITSVKHTGDKISLKTKKPAIIYRWCKKSLHECKQQPNGVSPQKKLPV
jgi:hypothetical protein